MSKSGLKFKSSMEREQVAVLLEDMARSLRKGIICAQQDPDFLTLTPGEVISVEFEAAQKKDKEKVELELSWRQEVTAEATPTDFKISAQQPEIKIEPPKPEPESKPEAKPEAKAAKPEAKPETKAAKPETKADTPAK